MHPQPLLQPSADNQTAPNANSTVLGAVSQCCQNLITALSSTFDMVTMANLQYTSHVTDTLS